jgi:hypothetical protein
MSERLPLSPNGSGERRNDLCCFVNALRAWGIELIFGGRLLEGLRPLLFYR